MSYVFAGGTGHGDLRDIQTASGSQIHGNEFSLYDAVRVVATPKLGDVLLRAIFNKRLGPRASNRSATTEGLVERRGQWDALFDEGGRFEELVERGLRGEAGDVFRGRSLEVLGGDPIGSRLEQEHWSLISGTPTAWGFVPVGLLITTRRPQASGTLSRMQSAIDSGYMGGMMPAWAIPVQRWKLHSCDACSAVRMAAPTTSLQLHSELGEPNAAGFGCICVDQKTRRRGDKDEEFTIKSKHKRAPLRPEPASTRASNRTQDEVSHWLAVLVALTI